MAKGPAAPLSSVSAARHSEGLHTAATPDLFAARGVSPCCFGGCAPDLGTRDPWSSAQDVPYQSSFYPQVSTFDLYTRDEEGKREGLSGRTCETG
jgi:hypothetical protein